MVDHKGMKHQKSEKNSKDHTFNYPPSKPPSPSVYAPISKKQITFLATIK